MSKDESKQKAPETSDDELEVVSVDGVPAETPETQAEQFSEDKSSSEITDGIDESQEETTDSEDFGVTSDADARPDESKKQNKFKRALAGYWRKKAWTLPLTLVVVLGVVFALPATRYPLLALGIKRSYTITLTDSKTHTPVSGAKITLGSSTVTTDGKGTASVRAKVGKRSVVISKQYYRSVNMTIFVGIADGHNTDAVALAATGRQVPIMIVNSITHQPVANAEIKILDTEAKTDSQGKATIVLPTMAATYQATVGATGYNDATATAHVTSQVSSANTFTITPAGRVYFLSNLSGTIDVVSTNLDGTSRKTVLAGTGQEAENATSLYHSADWKYLALLSKRDGGSNAKLFLIDTGTGQLTTMDEGNAAFSPIGWAGHRFVYFVNRTNVQMWQPNREAIKSYNADTGAIAVLDQTTADGTQSNYAYQDINAFGNYGMILSGNTLLYAKNWQAAYGSESRLTGKTSQLVSINADGSNKQVVKSFPLSSKNDSYITLASYKPNDVYIGVSNNAGQVFYEYKNGSIASSNTITSDALYERSQPQYFLSPAGDQTFWSESRDGKNTLLIGDANGDNGKQIASLSDYAAYGWYNANYVLVAKSNTLYIMPVSGGSVLKVTDYL